MENNTKPNPYLIPFAIVVAGIIVAGAVMYSQTPHSPRLGEAGQGSAGVSPDFEVNIKQVDIKGEPFIGKVDAPVILAYWLDFQCPFCKRFDLQTLPALVEKYVNAGKLKVVFKDFQFLGPDSQTAGLAAHALWELYPAKYFEWHQAMFEAQDNENGGFGSKEDIVRLTKKIQGIDENAVSVLMDQKKTEYQAEQDADKTEAGQLFGIGGTPGFILGSQKISGAQPLEVFSQLVDAELAKIKK